MMGLQEIMVWRGDDIKETIESFILHSGWENAYISGGIGSVEQVVFTTPIDSSFPPKVTHTTCPGPGELLSFTGEVMRRERMDPSLEGIYNDEGPLFIHIHASAAFAGGEVRGGGLKSGKAFRSIKIYIQQV